METEDAVAVRRARPADAAAMAALAREAYEPYVARIGRPPAPLLSDYDALAAEPDTWVAEVGGRLVGFLVLQVHPDHVLVDNIAVDPGLHGQGLGSRLLRLAEAEAVRRALPEVRLYTNEAMTENLAYYPRRGFRETHRKGDGGYRRVFFTKVLD